MRRRGRIRCLAVAGVLYAAGWGCAGPDGPRGPLAADGVVDDRGEFLDVTVPRRRIISLVPSVTETVVALGGADRLVARTRFDRDPRLGALPSVGGGVDPDLERIVSMGPDLVIFWVETDSRGLGESLRVLGIDTYGVRLGSIGDFRRHTRDLGRLVGLEGRADSLLAAVDQGLGSLRVAPPDARRSLLFVAWPDPILTTGSGTFTDEIIRLVGGRGLFDDVSQPWPTVSLESVVARQPDLILVASGVRPEEEAAGLLMDRRWGGLRAVREGHVHGVDADLFTRPGPRMVEAARILSVLLNALGPIEPVGRLTGPVVGMPL